MNPSGVDWAFSSAAATAEANWPDALDVRNVSHVTVNLSFKIFIFEKKTMRTYFPKFVRKNKCHS